MDLIDSHPRKNVFNNTFLLSKSDYKRNNQSNNDSSNHH